MILIWSGFGFLVPLLPFGLALLTNLLVDSILGPHYFDEHAWPLAFALWVAAGLLWTIGKYLDKKHPGRVLIDPETGQQFHFKRNHSFFWLKLQIWAPVIAVAAIVTLFLHRGV
ncbi:hypothetical protein JJB07_18485 [Tumebacillus sp. ITR2]|uniref:DUF3899 domain-containing protein n=1 Tax=Tumebacillus amylolyticus TaxID=2801339 RepID=A0ABS1JE95_9BACL|nr:hypothetical protein [Tumebacillus amylolyticus]MBL0388596.1 hypothetical protein [Tumebacillus amylolyticus]